METSTIASIEDLSPETRKKLALDILIKSLQWLNQKIINESTSALDRIGFSMEKTSIVKTAIPAIKNGEFLILESGTIRTQGINFQYFGTKEELISLISKAETSTSQQNIDIAYFPGQIQDIVNTAA